MHAHTHITYVAVFHINKTTCIKTFGTQYVPTGICPCVYGTVCACVCAYYTYMVVYIFDAKSVIAMCLYSMSALLIHLYISTQRDSLSLTPQPHYSHTLPPTSPPLVWLIIACHFATHTHTHMHARTHTHAYTHTCSPFPLFPFTPSLSAILLLLLPLFMKKKWALITSVTFVAFQPF